MSKAWGAVGNFTTCNIQGAIVVGSNLAQLCFDMYVSLLYYLLVGASFTLAR